MHLRAYDALVNTKDYIPALRSSVISPAGHVSVELILRTPGLLESFSIPHLHFDNKGEPRNPSARIGDRTSTNNHRGFTSFYQQSLQRFDE